MCVGFGEGEGEGEEAGWGMLVAFGYFVIVVRGRTVDEMEKERSVYYHPKQEQVHMRCSSSG